MIGEKIKKPFRKIKIIGHPFPRMTLFASFAVLIAALAFLVAVVSSFPSPVILRFNERQGVLLFGERAQVFGVWLFFFALWALNALLAEFFYFRERFLAYLLVILNGFLSLFLVGAVVAVMLVN